jgi:hypothetical protein
MVARRREPRPLYIDRKAPYRLTRLRAVTGLDE